MAMGFLVPSSSAPYRLSSPVATISGPSSWVPVQLSVRKSRRPFHLCCVQAHTQRSLGFVSSGFWSSGGWDPEQRKLAVVMVKTSAAPIELQASALPEAQAVAPHEEGIKPVKMKIYKLSELNADQVQDLRNRPRIDFSSIFETVAPIVENVQKRGDAAVRDFSYPSAGLTPKILMTNPSYYSSDGNYSCHVYPKNWQKYTKRFDGVDLEKIVERVCDLPDPVLDSDVKAAFDVAYDNIYVFHAAQRKTQQLQVETMPGVQCWRVARAVNAVGLYVPGGTAVLPSTALMLAVPAQIAGCKTTIIATPPRKDGSLCPEVVYCAKRAGVSHILKAGGAQAVAAMAWGTESCPKVHKILGPGNQYVTAAKMTLQNSEAMVSIDMPAGPSEVLVIADKYASPVHVAADLLSQAEHGPDSQVVLVAVGDEVDTGAIEREIVQQCLDLPRGTIAAKALSHSFVLVVKNMAEACNFSNIYAPEHLIVNVEDAELWLDHLDNAGSVFLGRWTPESVGDYASGTNHVLPTYGYARMYGGVSLDSFVKYMTVQSLTAKGLQRLGPSVAKMAEVEGLDAHRRAVTLRLQDIQAAKSN